MVCTLQCGVGTTLSSQWPDETASQRVLCAPTRWNWNNYWSSSVNSEALSERLKYLEMFPKILERFLEILLKILFLNLDNLLIASANWIFNCFTCSNKCLFRIGFFCSHFYWGLFYFIVCRHWAGSEHWHQWCRYRWTGLEYGRLVRWRVGLGNGCIGFFSHYWYQW